MTARTEKLMESALAWVAVTVITALIAWATWATAQTMKHEAHIAVVETRADNIDKSLEEIKAGQRETNKLLASLLSRRK